MLDGLLGRGFSAKCKSSIKLIKSRIDVIRRKRNAMQKFLKKDIADLLASNLETNAYGRADGLLVELTLSSCYDLVEQYCGSIARHLSLMQKQSECPGECREAVASLIFAAARFSDLPELRDLRQMFTAKYGNSLEPFVAPEFVEKLGSNRPTKEMKLQLMQEIAKEFSVNWDPKDFGQKKSNPPEITQDRPNRHGSLPDRQNYKAQNDGLKPQIGKTEAVLKGDKPSRGRRELTDEGHRTHKVAAEETVTRKDNQDVSSHGRRDIVIEDFKSRINKEETVPKRDNQEVFSRRSQEHIVEDRQLQNGVEETVPKRENRNVLTQPRPEFMDSGNKPRNDRDNAVLSRGNPDISSRGRRVVSDNVDETITEMGNQGGRRVNERPEAAKADNSDNIFAVKEEVAHRRGNRHISSHGRRDASENMDETIMRNEGRGGRRANGRREPGFENTDSIFTGKEEVAHRRRDNSDISSHGRREVSENIEETIMKTEDRGGRRANGRREPRKTENTDGISAGKEEVAHGRDNQHISSHGRREQAKTENTDGISAGKEEVAHGRDNQHISSHGRREQAKTENTDKIFADKEAEKVYEESKKPLSRGLVPPPYVKPSVGKYGTHNERQEFGHTRVNDHRDENEYPKQDDLVSERKPKPTSVRRRHLKPSPGYEHSATNEDVDEVAAGKNRETRVGLLQVLADDIRVPKKDEEEKMMDQLLSHYSKKPSKYEPSKVKEGLNSANGERHQNGNGGVQSNWEPVHRRSRTVSQLPEPETPKAATTRSVSLQPERSIVHPNLPDYDDLAARIASLRRRG